MKKEKKPIFELVSIELIESDPDPLRKELDHEHIEDLAASIQKTGGALDPLLVKPIADGRYQLLGGNHRYRALQQLGWQEVPCTIVEPENEAQEFLMKLHSNTKRRALSPLEECEAMVREKQIYEAHYPETRHGHNSKKLSVKNAHSSIPPSYVEVKAKAMGVDPSTIRKDIQIGKTVQEIPELKEADITKDQIRLIAKRKPEDKATLKQALKTSSNKPATVREYLRREPAQDWESDADKMYRHIKDGHRALKYCQIDWSKVCMFGRLAELVENEKLLQEYVSSLLREQKRIQQVISDFRQKY